MGHPVSHSVSPVIHHAAYRELGIDAHYTLVDCPDEAAVRAQVERIRSGELAGANITVPWKQVAFESADEWDASAVDVGVANVLARTEAGKIRAYNTDAIGLASDMERCLQETGVTTSARGAALVVGSGGATRAAVVACKRLGIDRIGVTARRFDPGQPKTSWPNSQSFVGLGAEVLPWPTFSPHEVEAFVESASLIVQATSAGMKGAQGGEELAALIPFEKLGGSGVAYDLVYIPVVTPFMTRANECGLKAEGGLGMLIGQAAHAIEIWTGKLPAREPLLRAAQEALGL